MKRRDFLKIGATIPFIPMIPQTTPGIWGVETPPWKRGIWGVETPPWKRVLDLTKEELLALRDSAKNSPLFTKAVMDFAESFGDTIKEKYEHLYVKTAILSCRIHRISLKNGANFIIAPPEAGSIYIVSPDFIPDKAPIDKTFLNPPGDYDKSYIQYVGTICSRWRLYITNLYKAHELVLGVTTNNGAIQFGDRNIGYLTIRNFIV